MNKAPDALAFLAHHERAERGELHGFAPFEAIGDLLEDKLDQRSGFGARQPDLLIDRLAEVGTRYCLFGHPAAPTPIDILFIVQGYGLERFGSIRLGRYTKK